MWHPKMNLISSNFPSRLQPWQISTREGTSIVKELLNGYSQESMLPLKLELSLAESWAGNRNPIEDELVGLQMPVEELHYRGVQQQAVHDDRQWSDHTIESRGLFVLLLWAMKNRALKAKSKLNAMNLLQSLVMKAFNVAGVQMMPWTAMLTKPDGRLISRELRFSMQGLCQGFGEFLRLCPGAVALWVSLGTRCWLNRCISSSMDNASFGDVWFFMSYLYCHQKLKKLGQCLWLCVAKTCLPELIHITGRTLETLSQLKSNEALQMLPILKGKAGYARKVADPVNKIAIVDEAQEAEAT